jgi:alkaline phosphatase D
MFSMFRNTTLAAIIAGLGLLAAGGTKAFPVVAGGPEGTYRSEIDVSTNPHLGSFGSNGGGSHAGLSRRRVLRAAGLVTFGPPGLFRPAISRAADRPTITHGLQSGDVSGDSAIVWARVGQPSRLRIEFSTTESFASVIGGVYVDALPEDDLTGKAGLTGLPAGQDIFYRVTPQNLVGPAVLGESAIGHFRAAPADNRSVSFVWSGDTAGQGWGINEGWGGMRAYATMLRHQPDFFIHSGDTVYADGPIQAEVKLKDGTVWTNLVTGRSPRWRRH